MKRTLLTLLCLAAAAPAWADDVRPRLVAGGMSMAEPEVRTELFTKGAFSAGTVADTAVTEPGRMALGGYAAYAFQDFKLSSSLKGTADTSSADFSAAYTGFANGVTAFRVGYEWGHSQAFSINPAQAGMSVYSGALDSMRPYGDLSVSLSFSRDITPSLSLGGFAAASRKDGDLQQENSLHFGAGIGYKF